MFGWFRKKKEKQVENTEKCCCQGKCQTPAPATEMNEDGIIVLGTGCPKCHELAKNVLVALRSLEIDEQVHHITDLKKIAKYGVMTTPALVIDQKVVSYGKVLTVEEAKEIIQQYR
ncbi:small redox-active disulfide protein 2 [Granulicatella balaenopterae]|uniref:Small redox-active disulfide protein 2 n=1 Tax=Granulicatella balaenopterae TaxID=137733 RepID=A0A1H9MDD7_9LACT|nr:thioredoxin family protein [Granulicatella balaenopterae]SER21475.1 small redox-active disulfide protein 2 [Granulicatella balaenopterae]